ncbi:oogenesis-related [Lampris incognitus]|uniref:oogenesis-related n=1 Tax=Lampris incognitus TaxID=2546036 RepID=UPI0024B62937|nr:oogenesis-related [Lampris incognitus]
MVRAYHGVRWLLGVPFQRSCSTPARVSLSGRKRLSRFTRVLLVVLPNRVQAALGYPVSSSIGCSLSPEVRVSPTKPYGKGSKRKQDDLDEEEEEQQTVLEILTQELAVSEDSEEDPDYEPSPVESDTEEYGSHNNTESDFEVSEKGMVIIKDLETDVFTVHSN